jgi:hypothetical protein
MRRCLHCAVESELEHVEVIVPIILILVAVGAEGGDERAYLSLGLPVRLRMASGTHIQFDL